MASRYDSRTTIFSPEGRLYQVEYAMEAISQAGSALGIRSKAGIVLAAEKRILSKLYDKRKQSEKMYKIADHIFCAVAGISSDANILLNFARLEAQRYLATYQEPIPVEQLLQRICDLIQSYTQHGGQRPFGVSFIFGGWDEYFGFQLYQSDPSGNYGGWKAQAIGNNYQDAQATLRDVLIGKKEDEDERKEEVKEEMKEDPTMDEALDLAVKVMSKTMDTTDPTPEKLEFATVTRDDETGEVKFKIWNNKELKVLLKAWSAKRKEELKRETAAATGDI
eukprot:g7099.t1